MEWIVAILVVVLIVVVGFAGYCYADAQACRRWVAYVDRTNPADAITAAIRQTQAADQAQVATVAETIGAAVKSMMGFDQQTVITTEPYPNDVFDEVPTPQRVVPFAEMDPYFNDDLDLAPDDMVAT